MPRRYSEKDLKVLFGLSRNRCAFPRCENFIIANATEFDPAAVVGYIAHIVASSEAGPRGDPMFPKERLDQAANLLLLCGHHHALVDAQDATYTVDDLRRWKEAHERTPSPMVLPVPIPRQVPSAPRGFVDREQELELLDRFTAPADGPAVVLLTGGHGVGKTATSRYWAQRNSERFEDGQLHVDYGDLRHQGGVAVSDVLGGFLTAFGLPNEVIPTGLDQRSALFRSSTADKRLLVLLDDVEHPAEVTPLIPNSGDSVVVVAARARLLGLVGDRARPIRLERLDAETSAALLAEMIGEERVRAEPDAVSELQEFCAGLPVALRICGARLELNDRRPVSWLVEQLADEAGRLKRLSLDVVFNEAYAAIGPELRVAYRRSVLHPGPSLAVAVAAAACGLPLGETAAALEGLTAAELLEDDGERYRFHALLRIHAGTCADQAESAKERKAALRRVVRYYLHATRIVDAAITPTRLRIADPPRGTVDGLPTFRGAEDAFTWFETERPNLLAVLRAAVDQGLDAEVWRMCESLWPCYFNRKPYAEWVESHELGVGAARRCGDAAAEARMRVQLAKALIELGEHTRAERELVTARRLARRAQHKALQASVLEFEGHLDLARGRFESALVAFDDARAAFVAIGRTRGVALQEYHAGRALAGLEKYGTAVDRYRRALELINPTEDELLLGRTLIYLGEAYVHVGDRVAADDVLQHGLEIMRRHALPYYEARSLEVLAELAFDAGDVDTASERWRKAHSMYAALQSPRAAAIGSVNPKTRQNFAE